MKKYFRFKSDTGGWSAWYEIYSREFNTIIKHLNWGALAGVEVRYG